MHNLLATKYISAYKQTIFIIHIRNENDYKYCFIYVTIFNFILCNTQINDHK